jgi:hypothetical protein
MFRIEKKAVFPFIRCGLFDPEGMGAATRFGVSPVPLVPQEIVRLQRRSSIRIGEEGKIALQKQQSYRKAVFAYIVAFGKIPRAGFFPGY